MKIMVTGYSRDMGPTVIMDCPITDKSVRQHQSHSPSETSLVIPSLDDECPVVSMGAKTRHLNLNGYYRLSVELTISELLVLFAATVKDWSVNQLAALMGKSKQLGKDA